MVTVAGAVGLTVIMIVFELEGLFEGHVSFDVTLQTTLSLFTGT